MEILEVSGYTSLEKRNIARRYLVPKLLTEHGIQADWVKFQEDAIDAIIHGYTREAGVRELQRKLAAVLRGVAEKIVERPEGAAAEPIEITPASLQGWLGNERFHPEDAARNASRAGVAVGLAWTPHGGDILFIEATSLPEGKGHLTLTGQLGEVMKESAQIALTLARSTVAKLGTERFEFHKNDIHIHVPSGAIPKDGPSAGVTMLVALGSLLSNQPLPAGLAMTGEITLRGLILPVGGIKEKVLAAHRAGLNTVLLPRKNEPDLSEVPEEVRKELRFVLVETVDEALGYCLQPIAKAA
jgi:ATP-dependent Lon protease